MPGAEFFARLGLFVARDFLDAETCARLRADVGAAERVPGKVGDQVGERRVDVSNRSTLVAAVPSRAEETVDARLWEVMPEIERHFGNSIEGRQKLHFLVYRAGDFFTAHRDRNSDHDYAKRRAVSIVVFLNGESPEPRPEAYGGGALTFYGLLGKKGDAEVGLPLTGEEGVLVAFDSGLTHEVTPVTHGERHTVVTWLV